MNTDIAHLFVELVFNASPVREKTSHGPSSSVQSLDGEFSRLRLAREGTQKISAIEAVTFSRFSLHLRVKLRAASQIAEGVHLCLLCFCFALPSLCFHFHSFSDKRVACQ